MHFSDQKTNNFNSWLIDVVSLILFLFGFYLLFLGHYPLFTPDEGRYSEIGLNMAMTQDYVTPRMNGAIFLDKPILHFWLQALALKLFGISEWAARFFPALFGILGVLMTYIAGRHLYDRRTGWLAAIILATTPLYFGGAHYANLDLEVAVLISISLLGFITALHANYSRFFLFIAYLSTGLAFLAKGLIGFVFPVSIIGAWILLTRQWHILKKIHLPAGILLIFAVISPWYFLVQQANPQFMYYFFLGQQVIRYLSGAVFNNQMPAWFFIPVILIGSLPWSLFFLSAIFKKSNQDFTKKIFFLLWIAIIFIFFSIPHSKLVGYILPILPALSLLVAKYFSDSWSKPKKIIFGFCSISSIIFLLALTFNAEQLNKYSIKPLIHQLQPLLKPQDKVMVYFRYYYDLPFYLKKQVNIVADWDSPTIANKDNWLREFWMSLSFNSKNKQLMSESDFWRHWQMTPLYVFVSDNRLQQFQQHTKKFRIIATYKNTSLITNQL